MLGRRGTTEVEDRGESHVQTPLLQRNDGVRLDNEIEDVKTNGE